MSKSSSILGVGNSDMMSYGVEDQFSKANYEPRRMCAVEGLVETTAAGRFTPEKTGVWSQKNETYGSLMSKLSVTRSTGHLPRNSMNKSKSMNQLPPVRSTMGAAMSSMGGGSQAGGGGSSRGGGSQQGGGGSQYGGGGGGSQAGGSQAGGSQAGGSQAGGSQAGGSRGSQSGFVAPVSSRGRAQDSYRSEVESLR